MGMRAPATLFVVDADDSEEAIAERMAELMRAKGYAHPDGRPNASALHEALERLLKERSDGGKKTIQRQTVSNWVGGQAPRRAELVFLAKALDTEREYILFGSRRSDQLKKERQFLARVNEEELALLTAFRGASKGGQKTILKMTRGVAEDHPAAEGTVHNMRRKDDKLKL